MSGRKNSTKSLRCQVSEVAERMVVAGMRRIDNIMRSAADWLGAAYQVTPPVTPPLAPPVNDQVTDQVTDHVTGE